MDGGRVTAITTGGGEYDSDDQDAKGAAGLKADSLIVVNDGGLGHFGPVHLALVFGHVDALRLYPGKDQEHKRKDDSHEPKGVPVKVRFHRRRH